MHYQNTEVLTMFGRHKRGQAAMEFLLTYGWAILVALLVIGALAYFGVLNPQRLLPTKCEFSGQVKCLDKQLVKSTDQFRIRLLNGVGNPIQVTAAKFNSSQLTGIGTCDATGLPLDIGPSGEETITFTGCTVPGNVGQGTRMRGAVYLSYTDKSTSFPHVDVGSVILDVE